MAKTLQFKIPSKWFRRVMGGSEIFSGQKFNLAFSELNIVSGSKIIYDFFKIQIIQKLIKIIKIINQKFQLFQNFPRVISS